jgi:hypothetical protein
MLLRQRYQLIHDQELCALNLQPKGVTLLQYPRPNEERPPIVPVSEGIAERSSTVPGQTLIPPLRHHFIWHNDRHLEFWTLQAQGTGNRKGLHGLAEANLISKDVANLYICQDSRHLRDLMRPQLRCDSKGPTKLKLPLYEATQNLRSENEPRMVKNHRTPRASGRTPR